MTLNVLTDIAAIVLLCVRRAPCMTALRSAAATLLLALYLAHPAFAAPGDLDTTFNGTVGKLLTAVVGVNDYGAALAVQEDGKILLAGACQATVANGSGLGFCMMRWASDGSPDNTFGTNSKVVTPGGLRNETGVAVAVQPDGKIVLAGSCTTSLLGFSREVCIRRYLSNGSPDTSFGTGGFAGAVASTNDTNLVLDSVSLALQPDGKVVVATSCSVGSKLNFCALRFLTNGGLDTSFGEIATPGKVVTQIGTGTDTVRAMVLQPNGAVLLGGHCATTNGSVMQFCLARYTAVGVLDTSFNVNGKRTLQLAGDNDYLTGLARQADGKIVAAGHCGGLSIGCMLRLNDSGATDPDFDTNERISVSYTYLSRTAVQPDGRIIVAGFRNVDTSGSSASADFVVARGLNTNLPDETFGSGPTGTVLTAVATGVAFDYGIALALQPDGKILVGGRCSDSGRAAFCLARYEGGPSGYKNCKFDIDGDSTLHVATDVLITTRVALGFTGSAVLSGISFPTGATRTTWPLIRNYLITQCGVSLTQ